MIWNTTSEECLHILKDHSRYVYCLLKISENQIVSGSCDAQIRIWNTVSGECLHPLKEHNGLVFCFFKIYIRTKSQAQVVMSKSEYGILC